MKKMKFNDEKNTYLNYLQTISENIMPNVMANIALLYLESDTGKQEICKKDIDKSLEPLMTALINTYNFKVIPLELTYQLIRIKKYNIKNVNLLLEKTDIENYLNSNYAEKMYNEANQNIKNKENFGQEFLNYFEYALANKKVDRNKAIPYINSIISNHIQSFESNNKNVSEELMTNCIIYLTEHYMKKYVDNPKCEIIDFNNQKGSPFNLEKDFLIHGKALYSIQTIQLSKSSISSFYYCQNTAIFNTIFHELIHFDQEAKLYQLRNISSIDDYIQLKDHILKEYIDPYYNENYSNISFEKDAEFKAYILTERYFNSLGIISENINEIKARLYQQIKKYSDILRNINGQLEDLNSITNDVIKRNPDIIEKYPQLKIEMTIDENGTARKKDIEELEKDMNNINNDPNIKENERHAKLKLITGFISEQEEHKGKTR